MTTPDESGLIYRRITGDYTVSVDDSADPDSNPDQLKPNGTVRCSPILPKAGAFRRSTATGSEMIIPKAIPGTIKNGVITNTQGTPGITLLAEVDGIPVHWSIDVEVKDSESWTIFKATYNIDDWGSGVTTHLPDFTPPDAATDVELAAIQSAQAARDEVVAIAQNLQGLEGTIDTYARGGALQPTCLVEEDILDMVGNVFVIDRVNDETWGYASGRMYTTPDHGRSWVDRCAAPEASVIRGMIAAPDGEVTAFTNTKVYRSTGWQSGSPTWTEKLTANGLATFNRFSVGASSDGQRIILGQYGPGAGQAWTDSRYAHITIDGGVTWVQAWDSDTHSGNGAVDSHVHGCGYDEVTDRWFVSEGHSVGAGIWVAEGDGPTWEWTRPEGLRCDDPTVNTGMDAGPTIVMGTDDGMVCGSDDVLGGVYGIPRTTRIADLQLNYLWAWRPNRSGTNGFAQRAQRDPETGIVYMVTSSSGPAPVIMGGTAHNAALVWEWPNWAGGAGDFIEGLVVEPGGWVVAYGQEAGVRKSILGRVDKPTARSFPDRGGVMGGKSVDPTSIAVGRDADMGFTSTMGGNIQGVVIGNDAKGHTRGVTIGYGAESLGAGAVSIGAFVKAGTQGVQIGDRATGDGVGQTLVGYNATGGSGPSATGIGRNVNVQGTQSVGIGAYAEASTSLTSAFGYEVVASGLRSTSVGARSHAIHSDSVSIGHESVTQSTWQVAFGARHLAMLEGSTPNATAVQGGGCIWIAGGRLWFRSPTQAAVAIAFDAASPEAAPEVM